VLLATRVLQLVQTHILHVLPFGSVGQFSLRDACAGIFVSGLFMMYFGACDGLTSKFRAGSFALANVRHLCFVKNSAPVVNRLCSSLRMHLLLSSG
jgi:hypothetical protein